MIRADQPQTVDHVTLVQKPQSATDRSITEVELTFDDDDPLTVALDASSVTPAGQVISFPSRTASRLAVEITQVDQPTASRNGVGFSEVGFGDTRVSETVRLPVDLARQVGSAADGHRLDVVMTRLRNEPATHRDEELTLNRRFVIPDARSFLLSGTARVAPDAPDPVLDAALGTTAPGTQFSASSHLTGDVDRVRRRAFDHDPFHRVDAVGSTIRTALDPGVAGGTDHLRPPAADLRRRPKHFVPGQVTLLADGVPVRTLPIPDVRTRDGRRESEPGRPTSAVWPTARCAPSSWASIR